MSRKKIKKRRSRKTEEWLEEVEWVEPLPSEETALIAEGEEEITSEPNPEEEETFEPLSYEQGDYWYSDYWYEEESERLKLPDDLNTTPEEIEEAEAHAAVEDAMAAWARELRRRPLLDKDQEQQLAKRMEEATKARLDLLQRYVEKEFGIKLRKRKEKRNETFDDYFQFVLKESLKKLAKDSPERLDEIASQLGIREQEWKKVSPERRPGYLAEIISHRYMEIATPKELEIIKDGEEARQIMIESNLRLVVSIARRYRGYGVPLNDLIQEGNIGLIQAVDRFDWRKGTRFSTCATLWIRQAVIRAIQAQSQLVKLPTRISEQLHKINRAREIMTQELGREPTPQELSRFMKVPRTQVEELLGYPHQVSSLDEPVDTEEKVTLLDAIEDTSILNPEEEMIQRTLREHIDMALNELPENYQTVIKLRYGLEDGQTHTYEEIGRRLGLSRQRVKQIADVAIKRLRQHPLLRQARLDAITS
ncbi:MAG: RNA polymerase sigma factor RpoD/SigA [Armatimonadetes bacterium]|nr:RNA polymerase sigma factor RpoD/SigA [Armatimonadota bacterium]